MSFNPDFLDSKDAAFIEPRIIFDCAITNIEDRGEYKKLFYSKDKLKHLMGEHYPTKDFSKIEKVIKDAEYLIELV
jgi:hypothetical protein